MNLQSEYYESNSEKTDWIKLIRIRLDQTSMGNPSDDVLEESQLEQIRNDCATTLINNICSMCKSFHILENDGLAVMLESPKVVKEDLRLGITAIHNYSLLRTTKRFLSDVYECQTSGYRINFNSSVCIMSAGKSKNHKLMKRLFNSKKLQSCNPLDLNEIFMAAEPERVLVKGRVIETDAESLAIVFFCRAERLEEFIAEKTNFIIQLFDANIERRITSLIKLYKQKKIPQSLWKNIDNLLKEKPIVPRPPKHIKK